MPKVPATIVHAFDEKGRVFGKRVTARIEQGQKILSLEYPTEYKQETIRKFLWGTWVRLCIDIEGRHHLGSPVWIDRREMKKAYDWALTQWEAMSRAPK